VCFIDRQHEVSFCVEKPLLAERKPSVGRMDCHLGGYNVKYLCVS
jgi:hypothetical protein